MPLCGRNEIMVEFGSDASPCLRAQQAGGLGAGQELCQPSLVLVGVWGLALGVEGEGGNLNHGASSLSGTLSNRLSYTHAGPRAGARRRLLSVTAAARIRIRPGGHGSPRRNVGARRYRGCRGRAREMTGSEPPGKSFPAIPATGSSGPRFVRPYNKPI